MDSTRDRTSDNPTVKYSVVGGLPFPDEQERNCKENYQGPWEKDDNTWKNFNVEFFAEADNRTLKSWERYQRGATPSDHIVYSIYLPAVPTYPDKRTVVAKARVSEVKEKVPPNPSRPNTGTHLTNTISSSARKRSTVAFGLQPVPEPTVDDTSTTWPSIDDTVTPRSGSEQKSTFVLDTAIPPTRMSSIHSLSASPTPIVADSGAEMNISSVPQFKVQGNEAGKAESENSSLSTLVAQTADEAGTGAELGAGAETRAEAEEPLLSRRISHE
jgi:hypothetical protein